MIIAAKIFKNLNFSQIRGLAFKHIDLRLIILLLPKLSRIVAEALETIGSN